MLDFRLRVRGSIPLTDTFFQTTQTLIHMALCGTTWTDMTDNKGDTIGNVIMMEPCDKRELHETDCDYNRNGTIP